MTIIIIVFVILGMISTFKNANLIALNKRSAQPRIIRDFVAIIKTYAKCLHKTIKQKKRQVKILDAFLKLKQCFV